MSRTITAIFTLAFIRWHGRLACGMDGVLARLPVSVYDIARRQREHPFGNHCKIPFLFFSLLGVGLHLLIGGAAVQAADVYLESQRQGHQQIPIAVLRFTGSAGGELVTLAESTFRNDLVRSGFFDLVDVYRRPGDTDLRAAERAGAMVTAAAVVDAKGGDLTLIGRAWEIGRDAPVVEVKLTGDAASIRRMSHRLADKLVTYFTGEPGIAQTQIAYVSDATGHKEVYVMDYDGGNETRLTSDRSIILFPHWSHDGGRIAYTSYRTGNPDAYLLEMSTGARKPLLSAHGINYPPVWTPSGERWVFASTRTGDAEIYTMPAGGGDIKRLTFNEANDLSPVWSALGKQIAFTSDRGGLPQIYVMEADGANVRRLTFTGDYNTSPSWSPKGDRIAYACRNGEKRMKICIVDTDGQNPVQVTEDGPYDDESPSWAPNGRDLVFTSNRVGKRHLFAIRADGTQMTRLTTGNAHHTAPVWSPK